MVLLLAIQFVVQMLSSAIPKTICMLNLCCHVLLCYCNSCNVLLSLVPLMYSGFWGVLCVGIFSKSCLIRETYEDLCFCVTSNLPASVSWTLQRTHISCTCSWCYEEMMGGEFPHLYVAIEIPVL